MSLGDGCCNVAFTIKNIAVLVTSLGNTNRTEGADTRRALQETFSAVQSGHKGDFTDKLASAQRWKYSSNDRVSRFSWFVVKLGGQVSWLCHARILAYLSCGNPKEGCDVFFRLSSIFTLLVKWHAFNLTGSLSSRISPSLLTPEEDQFSHSPPHRLIPRGQQRPASCISKHSRPRTHKQHTYPSYQAHVHCANKFFLTTSVFGLRAIPIFVGSSLGGIK